MELSFGTTTLKSRQQDLASETALVERCRRQDAEAFAKIVDAYQHRVYGFLRRMVGDPDDAADLAQDVFVRAYQAFERFDGRSSLRTWLFRIAHNLCVDRARRIDRSPQETRIEAAEEDQPLEFPDARWNPERVVINEELDVVIEGALNSMSEKLKSVLLLHDKEDMAYEEIGNTLGLPVGTVKSRLFLARAHLQNIVGAYLRAEEHSK